VSDDQQLRPFDAALRQATEGRFLTAITGLERVLKALPEFGEARFLLGVFQWSAGLHAEAMRTGHSRVGRHRMPATRWAGMLEVIS
jgi:hypothetical protein